MNWRCSVLKNEIPKQRNDFIQGGGIDIFSFVGLVYLNLLSGVCGFWG